MIFLQRGDRLPTVAVVQTLLNARMGGLRVDGYLGPLTEKAISHFQRTTMCSGGSGKIDNATWQRLNRIVDLSVVDAVDICHPNVDKSLKEAQEYNKNAMAIGCMSNATEAVINQIVNQNNTGSVVLVRFIGHGAAGIQAIGMGRGVPEIFGDDVVKKNGKIKLTDEQNEISKLVHRYSTISGSEKGLKYVQKYLALLVPVFSPFGSIEFHGCHISAGKEGLKFLREISDLIQVPVSASTATQHMGHNKRFSGPIRSAFPGGTDLQRWAAALPKFNMSIP